ncbi:MAG: protein kinase, partial [Anaerolineales bacterium]|nr:protein kinase [Anaerolineales bacterium]
TATGAVLGTVSYMAPEQIKGERPDHRADLYALGVILYEMITGERPFKGDNSASTMMMHLTEPVPDLRQVVSPTDFSGIDMLAAVVQKAMAKEPNQRFQSAAELASAIRNYSPPADDATIVDNSAATILHNFNDTVVAGSAPTVQSRLPAAAESSSSKPPWTLIGIIGAILTVLIFGAVWAFSGDDNDSNDPALPAVAEATATFPPLDPEGDEDGDGLKNGRELEIGTNPTKFDTDDDGIPDTAENSVPCLDALNPDTDGDGISDNEDDDPCGLEATPTPTLSVTITEITLNDNRYNVDFTTDGFTPAPGGHHVHFFFDTVTEENSGIPGDGPWDIHTNPDSFTGWGPIDKPAEATQMCAIVANSDHSTILGTSHCFDLPESTAAAPEMTVQITAIELINERYEVTFATAGYTPSPASQHIHFFFNTVDPEQAGVPGEGPWQIHTSPEPFSALGPNDRPDDAMQLCALVADPDHTVRQATGNCFNLPDMGYNYGG